MKAWAIALLGAGLVSCGARSRTPPPSQPLPFNHRVHAGQNLIGCTSCHVYATRSPVAGIPSMARCHGCHRFVDTDKADVQALNKAFDDGKPIEWTRVYRVPDHVYFTHQRHVAAGRRCQECHGEVQQMDVIRQVAPLTMGWCVECHQRYKAPLDCWTCHK